MRIYIEKDYDAMSCRMAQIIAAEITHNPACVLGLATGSTPEGSYKYLVDWHKQGCLSFQDVISVNLDEYVGLAPTHDQSYRYFMQSNLFDHVDILPENTRVPDGLTNDPAAFCEEYDAYIRSLGYVDLQLLGIGRNGHIGFNEPGDCFVKETHVVDLTESTIDANARFFTTRDDVPKQASGPSWGPRRFSWPPAAWRRPTPSWALSAGPLRLTAPAPSFSCTPMWLWWWMRPPEAS